MAIVVLAQLHLLTLEQVPGRHVEPARNCFHQLIAGDREAIYVATAGPRVPGRWQHGGGTKQRRDDKQSQSLPRFAWCKRSMLCRITHIAATCALLRIAHPILCEREPLVRSSKEMGRSKHDCEMSNVMG